MENRLTKLEETDKHILQMVSELKEHSVTKVEHAMVLSSVNDLQTDFDDYQRDNKKKLEEVKANRKLYSIPKELKKMYFAARDESKPAIKFSNVTPELVNDSYGDTLTIQ